VASSVLVELQQLRTFVAVAEDLHMGRAARRLHLAQPTLSRQIAALERELGVELFSRARRRFQLTSAGAAFLTEAREILERTDHARLHAQRAARGEIGVVRLGFVQSATYEALPLLARRFRAECPDVRLDARPMTTLEQLAALTSDQLDAGLLRPQQPADNVGGLQFRVLSRDSMVVALPAGHRLSRRRKLALTQLSGEPFILHGKEVGSTGYDLILERCAQAGFVPDVIHHTHNTATIVALVSAGLGVSILISPPPPIDPALVVYRPLTGDLPTWDLALAWSPSNPSAALARLLALD
jgi:DNA-binding transcriptional LysR family regulator